MAFVYLDIGEEKLELKNKFVRLSMMLILTLLLITGCKIQSVEEFDKKEKIESEEIVDSGEELDSKKQDENEDKDKEEIAKKSKEKSVSENKDSKEKDTKKDTNKDTNKDTKETRKKNTDSIEKDKTKSNNKEVSKADTRKGDTSKKKSLNKDKTTSQTQTKPVEKPKPQPDKVQVKPEPKPQVKPQPKPQPQPVKKYVTLEIRVDTILKNYDKLDEKLKNEKFVPSSGVVFVKTKFELKDGETPLDILAKTGIHMDSQGSGGSAYVRGINNVYEFSCGELSGWMYKVNGSYPNSGVGAYTLKDGDVVSFNYTCNLGRDL